MAGANPMAGATPMAAANANPGQNAYPQNVQMYQYPNVSGMGSPYGSISYPQQQYGMAAVPGTYNVSSTNSQTYKIPTPYNGAVPMNGSGDGMMRVGSQPIQQTPNDLLSNSSNSRMNSFASYPKIEKIKFHIPANLKDKYANLYSIIATVDALMTESIEGNVSQEDVDAILPNYKKMYEMIKKALHIDDEQVKTFCDSVNLVAGYAFHAFEECGKQPEISEEKKALTAGELMQLGTRFTTLSDYCSCGGVKTSDINTLFKEIITAISKTDFLKENDEGASLARQCKELLNSQPQDQPLNEQAKKDFMYKILTLHRLFMGSL